MWYTLDGSKLLDYRFKNFSTQHQLGANTEMKLHSLLERFDLTQHIVEATRKHNLLDLVITSTTSKLVRNPLVLNSQSVSDHDILVCNLDAIIEKQKPVFQTFRKIKNIDHAIFKTTLLSSTIFSQPATTVDEYVEQIKVEITKALDKVAPIQTKRKSCPKSTWLSPEAQDAKRNRRKLEKRWNATRDENIKVKYRQACRRANRLIVDSRKNHFASKIESASDNPKQQWTAIKNLLHPQGSKTVSRDKDASADFCKSISDFFNTKILDLKLAIADRLRGTPRTPMAWDIQHQGEHLNKIQPATIPEVLKLISNMPGKLSPLDFVPTPLIKSCADIFAPIISHLANLSFTEGKFPTGFKLAQITPILKKDNLDPDSPVNRGGLGRRDTGKIPGGPPGPVILIIIKMHKENKSREDRAAFFFFSRAGPGRLNSPVHP